MATPRVPTVIPDVLDRLCDIIAARPALRRVQVASAPLGEQTELESIQLGNVSDTVTDNSDGGSGEVKQSFVIDAMVWAVASDPTPEKAIRKSRRRAYALLGEVVAAVRAKPTLDNLVFYAKFGGEDLDSGPHERGRWTQLSWQIEVEAYVDTLSG